MPKYDVPGIVQEFNSHRFPERAELVKEFTAAMDHPSVKILASEIGAQAVDSKANPMQVLGLGLMYGMVLGVLCEKHRRRVPGE